MTKELEKAFNTIKKHHPNITMVIFNKYGQWCYCDDNFNAPAFGDEIDVSILEEAADSISILPYVYHEKLN